MGSLAVIPDVLLRDPVDIQAKITAVAGLAERFHVDIIDGVFADNLTVTPADLGGVDFGTLAIDLHLMVDDPTSWVGECVAIKPGRIIAHIERMGRQRVWVDAVRTYSPAAVGLALDLFTPVSSLDEEVLEGATAVLLMSVKAGYSGQAFHPQVLAKVRELRSRYEGRIIVDGGVTPEVVPSIAQAGADEVAVNSYLWSLGTNRDILTGRLEALQHA